MRHHLSCECLLFFFCFLFWLFSPSKPSTRRWFFCVNHQFAIKGQRANCRSSVDGRWDGRSTQREERNEETNERMEGKERRKEDYSSPISDSYIRMKEMNSTIVLLLLSVTLDRIVCSTDRRVLVWLLHQRTTPSESFLGPEKTRNYRKPRLRRKGVSIESLFSHIDMLSPRENGALSEFSLHYDGKPVWSNVLEISISKAPESTTNQGITRIFSSFLLKYNIHLSNPCIRSPSGSNSRKLKFLKRYGNYKWQ